VVINVVCRVSCLVCTKVSATDRLMCVFQEKYNSGKFCQCCRYLLSFFVNSNCFFSKRHFIFDVFITKIIILDRKMLICRIDETSCSLLAVFSKAWRRIYFCIFLASFCSSHCILLVVALSYIFLQHVKIILYSD